MIERIILWQYENRGKLFLLLLLPFVIWGVRWLAELYDVELRVNTEYPVYKIQPKHQDDTLRVAVIGDSWAWYHTTLSCDTIFLRYSRKLTRRPVKCFLIGHSAKVTKDIYNDMFTEHAMNEAWEPDYCSQPLIEQHPDYCVIMAGINDMRLCKPAEFYVGNYRLMLNLLLQNGIRPVVMEMPGVDLKFFHECRRRHRRLLFDLLSLWTKIDYSSTAVYREAMKEMLRETGLADRVLFIPVSAWNPGGFESAPELYLDDRLHLNLAGYHVLDSCMASEIIKDLKKTNEKKQ